MKQLLALPIRLKIAVLFVAIILTTGAGFQIAHHYSSISTRSNDSNNPTDGLTNETKKPGAINSPSTATNSTDTKSKSIATKSPTTASSTATPAQTNAGASSATQTITGCAYPLFPDGSCTGWQHTSAMLTRVPGQITSGPGWNWEGAPFNYVKITSDGAVLDSLDISGCVFIDTDAGVNSFTVKRSRVSGSCDYLFRFANTNGTYAANIIDTELVGGAVQMSGSGFTWLRVNSHDFTGKAAMMGTNTLVQDSYIHGNICNPPDHQSGIGTNGGSNNIVMRHNNVDLTPSDCTSGGISNYDDFGAFSNVTIEQNLINSAGYCLKAGYENNNAMGNGYTIVRNNVFGRKYYPECGYWGVVSNWMPSIKGSIWSGNTWGGGAAATASHQIGDVVSP